MDRTWRQWLARTLGITGQSEADPPREPRFTEPLTIEQFETLRDEAPEGMEILSGSTTWIDDQERITAVIIGDRTSNKVVFVGYPPGSDGWKEFGDGHLGTARGQLAQAMSEWENDPYLS